MQMTPQRSSALITRSTVSDTSQNLHFNAAFVLKIKLSELIKMISPS